MNNIQVLPDYQAWRDFIFTVNSTMVEITSTKPDTVYGVIVDVGLADDDGTPVEINVAITITAFPTGESSLRPTWAGGFMGLIAIPEIAVRAKEIVELAQPLFDITESAQNHDLPTSGKIYFYFLTISGIRLYKTNLPEVSSAQDPFNTLFNLFGRIKTEVDNRYVKSSS